MIESHLRKGDGGGVLSSISEMAYRSGGLGSKRKDDQHIDWCRSRLRYKSGRSPL